MVQWLIPVRLFVLSTSSMRSDLLLIFCGFSSHAQTHRNGGVLPSDSMDLDHSRTPF